MARLDRAEVTGKSHLSAPAIIPATSATTLVTGFDPAAPETRTCSRITRCRPARSATPPPGPDSRRKRSSGHRGPPTRSVASSHLSDALLLGALEPSLSPIVPDQKGIRLSRSTRDTNCTGGSTLNDPKLGVTISRFHRVSLARPSTWQVGTALILGTVGTHRLAPPDQSSSRWLKSGQETCWGILPAHHLTPLKRWGQQRRWSRRP